MIRTAASKGLRSIYSQRVNAQKGHHSFLTHARLFTSGNFFTSDANSTAKNNSASAKITKSLLSKYYGQDDSRSNVIARSLSADVIASMMQEVTNSAHKIDFKTADMLVEQAILCGAPSVEAVESLLSFYLRTDNTIAAATTLLNCVSHKLPISDATCQLVIHKLLDHYHWNHAFTLVVHMVEQDYKLSPEVVVHTTGGVMGTAVGTVQVLELVRLIVDKRRSDLADMLDIAKISSFARSVHGTAASSHALPAQPLQDAMTASLTQLRQHGWYSSNAAQLLVSLACASGHDTMAAEFVREMVQAMATRGASAGSEQTTCDPLNLLRAIDQADCMGQQMKGSNRGRESASAVTLALLELCWANRFATQVLRQGPLRAADFFGLYWSLAYRARDAHLPGANSSNSAGADKALRRHYDELVTLVQNRELKQQDFSPQAGYERRCFRLLCDALGLEHRLRPLPGFEGDFTVRVTRHSDPFNLRPQPPSLDAILLQDATLSPAHRQFDGLPMYWQRAVEALESCLDPEKLRLITQQLLRVTSNSPSASWGLLFVEQLTRRDISQPARALRSLIKHCEARNDVYGLLEVLHLGHAEGIHHRNTRQGELSLPSADNSDAHSGSDGLSSADWARACKLALRPRHSNVPSASGMEIYSELMSVMQKSDRHQDPAVASALISFLASTGQDPGLLGKTLRRLYNDKSLAVTHTECNAVSAYLQRQLSPDRRILQLSRNTSAVNYLAAYPYTINRMSDVVYNTALEGKLGTKFARAFEQCWSRVHSTEGRRDLYKLVSSLFVENPKLWESLALPEEVRAREALTLLNIYTAYLTAVLDGQPRKAFDLLYETTQLHREAAVKATAVRENNARQVRVQKGKQGSARRERASRYDADI